MSDNSSTFKIEYLDEDCRTAKLGTRVTFQVPTTPLTECSLDRTQESAEVKEIAVIPA